VRLILVVLAVFASGTALDKLDAVVEVLNLLNKK
jgi:hypothetical protein